MIFTLEALEAKHGDSLLLHYGDDEAPKLMVIDGGPKGVYTTRLKPRLEELRNERVKAGKPLKIRLAMVSHIDEDHIQGMLELTNDMLESEDRGDERPYTVATLWHNSFEDLVKKVRPADVEALESAIRTADLGGEVASHLRGEIQPSAQLVVASVQQGRQLRGNSKKLAIPLNQGFENLIVAPAQGKLQRDMGSGVFFTIIGPRQDEVDALQNKWAAEIARMKKKGTLKPAEVMEAAAAAFLDTSVYNLSSLIVLAEVASADGIASARMLLTGDARGDHILEGLEATQLKKAGDTLHVDLLKLPHHGSARNVDERFFREITADHYVISANGKDDNPDVETLEMLFGARGNARYRIHFTNHVGAIDDFLKAQKPANVSVIHADGAASVPSLRVDLGSRPFVG
jgi:hypothetical protein